MPPVDAKPSKWEDINVKPEMIPVWYELAK